MAITLNLKQAQGSKGVLRDWAYNALDTTGTLEVWETLRPRLSAITERTYAFERALQAPALAMTLRGLRVDVQARNEAVTELKREAKKKARAFDKLQLIQDIWDGMELETGFCPEGDLTASGNQQRHKWPRGLDDDDPAKMCERCGCDRWKRSPINPNSPDQINHLFYDLLAVPPMKNKKGEVSVDKDVLDRIGNKYPKLKRITGAITEIKGLRKQIGFLNAKLSGDNRFHSSNNVGAAWTGRWSTSKDPFGRGSNVQNIASRHRHIFMADAGYDLCYADLEQAESNTVAHLAGDERYIEAHKAGDVHTYATRLIWPNMDWTGDIKKDRKLAEATIPEWDNAPGHHLRFQSKRIQHGGNYGLSPHGISKIAHIPLAAAKAAHRNYMYEFDRIPAWQDSIKKLVMNGEPLVNPLGRRARLFGRPEDPHTFKQGLAFLPQSTVADIINIAVWRAWNELEEELGLMLLGQIHDAILCQWPREVREAAAQRLCDIMTIPVPIGERTMTIGVEVAVGQNWGKRTRKNPHGIKEIKL